MLRKLPDWLLYALIVGIIFILASQLRVKVDAPPPPQDIGPLLPSETPKDDKIITQLDAPRSGIGTAFAINNKGDWLTARHVVDGCDQVAIKISTTRIIRADMQVFPDNDLAVLRTQWTRRPLPHDVKTRRNVGERGYFIGFPQGEPGEVVGTLIARNRMLVRGRYSSDESVLAWAEKGRTRGLKGSLGGLSGAPVLDKDGEVIGLVTAENPRRGRIYSVAPRALWPFYPDESGDAEPVQARKYGLQADRLRRDRRIAQVLCLVNNETPPT
jgi:S1-C subfamily serine protease